MNRSAEHSALKRDILLDLGADPRWRIFGNQAGLAWDPKTRAHIPFGLVDGASDILGIAKPRGRWCALEVKTGDAQPTRQQRNFLAMVNAFGGVGRVVRTKQEARAALEEACR